LHSPQRNKADGSGPAAENTGLRNWETARAFLEVARGGSFRSASQKLHVSVNTLRRQIEEFETETGHKLFTRHADGVRLTKEAEKLLIAAKRMEAAAFDITRTRALDDTLRGEVRLSVTEGLGTFWITPRLVELQQYFPGLLIEMICSMRPADVMNLESDIGLQITPPETKDLRVVKLGRIHAMPFASPEYLARYGQPRGLHDLSGHRIVLQISEQTEPLGFARLFPGVSQVGLVSIRTNSSNTHYWAIAKGAGIGILPTYIVATKTVEPVDVGLHFSQDIYLVYHPDLAKIPRVRLVIDWLVETFSARRYPWFAEDFIHPRDLPDKASGLSLAALLEATNVSEKNNELRTEE
jgi:DNA-binding transcriptional LysR family regulator